MEYPPSPTNSEPSRRGSILFPPNQAVASHPTVVHTRRPSRFSTDVPAEQLRPNESRSSLDKTNEQSPLLAPIEPSKNGAVPFISSLSGDDQSDGRTLSYHGAPSYNPEGTANPEPESKSSWYLFLLTIALGGLQLAWAVELSNGSPYLLSLGLSKSLLALVWIAGPLSGFLVQPYVGARSDRCQSRFGRRRPFIVGGAIATVLSLIALAWASEFIGALLPALGAPRDGQAVKTTTIVFAVLMVYILDFAVNVIQAAIRAFMTDNAPVHQQDAANAWASRLSNVGNIILYAFGYIDLPRYFWFFGNTQFKDLCVIASIGLLITVAMSCLSIKERDTRQSGDAAKSKDGLFAFFKKLYRTVRHLPTQISRVCQVQLAAWIGWFPVLFYGSVYIRDQYASPLFRNNPNLTQAEVDAIYAQGTRIGTLGFLIFAATSLAASVILPWFVIDPYKAQTKGQKRTPSTPGALGSASTSPLEAPIDYFPGHNNAHAAPDQARSHKSTLRRFFQLCRSAFTKIPLTIPGLTLRRIWLFSHIMFAVLMLSTFAVRTTTGAIVFFAFVGIPWAVTMWAPFALLAAEVRKREQRSASILASHPQANGTTAASDDHLSQQQPQQQASEAGLMLGIHNVSISAPQVLATLICMGIFKALEKPPGQPDDGSIGWVFRFSAICAILAAFLTSRVAEEEPLSSNEDGEA